MRKILSLLLLLPALHATAQLNNWDPTWAVTDSGLIFHNDLDYFLNAYTKADIKAMRREVSALHMNFNRTMRRTIADLQTYSEGGGMVPRMHDFTLPEANTGTPYHLAERKGRIRAFMFGSISNPPARHQLPSWSRMAKKYVKADVDLFVIYGRELHAGDRNFKHFPPPTTIEQKTAHARELAKLGTLPVLVDGMDDATFTAYGRAPNGVYVIDADGTLVFRGTWADVRKVEHIIDTLLKWYAAGKPAAFGW
ncbi:MAG: hypothetical protein JNM31_13675 [Flavobacteriales bacterium]|nr:hypothetical protein [Flavobacteriales bacterium]